MRKTALIIFLFASSVCSAATSEHAALAGNAVKHINLSKYINSSESIVKSGLEKKYKNINKTKLNLLFKEHDSKIRSAIFNAVSLESTADLKRLDKFYDSQEGKWYLKMKERVDERFEASMLNISQGFKQRLVSLIVQSEKK